MIVDARSERSPVLNLLVAVELWGPGHAPRYAPMAAAWPIPGDDPHSRSWSEYGVRTGIWTLLDLLAAHKLLATVAVSGSVADQFPDVVRAIAGAGHEVAAHAWTQDVLPIALDEASERAEIARCTEVISATAGRRPVGWMSPRASGSQRTDGLLAEQGYIWCGDHADRDRPEVIDTGRGSLVRMMHSDYSDVRDGGDCRRYRDLHRDLIDVLRAGAPGAVGTIAVHAHVGGRPLLAAMVDDVLATLARCRDQLRVITRGELAAELAGVRS